jgi:hypothetical protein
MESVLMPFRNILLILIGLYLLYLLKTAIGINLSPRYSGWDFLKWPVNCRSFSSYCVEAPVLKSPALKSPDLEAPVHGVSI